MMISGNLEETNKIAQGFISKIKLEKKAVVVALSGELGAGKTAFVKAVAKALGVEENITSPTFVIEKIYKLKNQKFGHLVHIDAYRLESGAELSHLGFLEILEDPNNIIFIEWPEKVGDVLSKERINIKMKFVNETTRQIEILSSKF